MAAGLAPCLKVELDGTEILPKKNTGLKWGDGVLDNEERDTIREAEAAAAEEAEEEEDYEWGSEEEEDSDFDEYEEVVPSAIMQTYIMTLARYGYADMYKLQEMSPEDWDDLVVNVGIEEEHVKHVMAAVGMKRRKIRLKKSQKRSSTPTNTLAGRFWEDDDDEEDDEEKELNEEEPDGMGDLIAMAGVQRKPSVANFDQDALSSPVGADTLIGGDGGGCFDTPAAEEPGGAGGLDLLRDRVAARKNEQLGQGDEDACRRPTDESVGDASIRPGAESLSVPTSLKDRIKDRKEKAIHAGYEEEGPGAWSAPPEPPPAVRSRTPPPPAAHAANDLAAERDGPSSKLLLRQRITDRKEGRAPLPDGSTVAGGPEGGPRGTQPGSPGRFTGKKKSSLGLMSAHATVGRATPPRSRMKGITIADKQKAAEEKRLDAEKAREYALAAKRAAKEERRTAAIAAAADGGKGTDLADSSDLGRGRARRGSASSRSRVPTPGRSSWTKPSSPRPKATSDKDRASEQQETKKAVPSSLSPPSSSSSSSSLASSSSTGASTAPARSGRDKSPRKTGRSPPAGPKARMATLFKSRV